MSDEEETERDWKPPSTEAVIRLVFLALVALAVTVVCLVVLATPTIPIPIYPTQELTR